MVEQNRNGREDGHLLHGQGICGLFIKLQVDKSPPRDLVICHPGYAQLKWRVCICGLRIISLILEQRSQPSEWLRAVRVEILWVGHDGHKEMLQGRESKGVRKWSPGL